MIIKKVKFMKNRGLRTKFTLFHLKGAERKMNEIEGRENNFLF